MVNGQLLGATLGTRFGGSALRQHAAASILALVSAVVVIAIASTQDRGHAQAVGATVQSVIPARGTWTSEPTGAISVNFSTVMNGGSPASVVAFGNRSGRRSGTLLGVGTANLSFFPIAPFHPGERVEFVLTNAMQSAANSGYLAPHVSRFNVRAGSSVGAFAATPVSFGAIPTAAIGTKSVAAVDLDGDGDIDIMEAAGGVEIRFWENMGNGTFAAYPSEVTILPNASSRLHAVDLDSDGIPEIWEARAPLNDRLWRAAGFGSYVEVPLPTVSSTNVASGDFNRDGRLDVVSIGPSGTRMLANDGAMMATSSAVLLHLTPQSAVATGDVDADGDLDIVVAGTAITVLRNGGYGMFSVPPSTFGMGLHRALECVDMNGDGRADIVSVAAQPGTGSPATGVYISSANTGTFAKLASPMNLQAGTTLAVGDLNGDGKPDVVFGGTGVPSITIWHNDGTGVMTSGGGGISGGAPGALALVDLSGDGVLDLVDAKAGALTNWRQYVPYDSNSTLYLASPAPTVFPSTTATAMSVMSLSIYDSATTDSLPTVVNGLVIDLSGSTANAHAGTWMLSGVGLLPVTGVVTGSLGNQRLTFSGLSVAASSGQSTTLHISLQIPPASSAIADGDYFHLAVSASTISTSHLGSQLNRNDVPVTNAGLVYEVASTEMRYLVAPPSLIAIGTSFNAVVAFTDIHGAIDRDVNGDIVTLRRGLVPIATASANQGLASFTGTTSLVLSGPADASLVLSAHDDPQGAVDMSATPAVTPSFGLLEPASDARIEAGPGIERDAISSVQSVPVVVFDFRIVDLGVVGSGASLVNAIRVSMAGSTAPGSAAIWTLQGAGVPGVIGTVSGAQSNEVLEFSGAEWFVAQGGESHFQLLCQTVASASGALDHSRWKLAVDASSFTFVAGGLHPGQTSLNNGPGMEFSVSATELRMLQAPPSLVYPTDPFEFSVHYTDVHGNRDTDIVGDRVTMARSDGGTVIQGLSSSVVAGVASFTGSRAAKVGLPAEGPFTLVLRDNQGGSITLLGAALQSASTTLASHSRCDTNFDGQIDVVDVQHVVNLILGSTIAEFPGEGDANGDSAVDVVDVQTIVNKVLNP